MESYDAESARDPQKLMQQAQAAFSEQAQHHGEHGSHESGSVREIRYKGHRIRIETTYNITVDGQPVGGHVVVNNEGLVHYHSIPNQEFPSAVDMVKRIIDLTPPGAGTPTNEPTHEQGHEGHDHGHHH